ncbi:MAG: hypothetical protein JWR69_2937 [Pedosphaera sp.]|nr:hypothetical protein [Pedosphaera sp.]
MIGSWNALPGAALVGNELSPGYNMAVLQTAQLVGECGGKFEISHLIKGGASTVTTLVTGCNDLCNDLYDLQVVARQRCNGCNGLKHPWRGCQGT